MAMHKLKPLHVQRLTKVGRHSDGSNLFLVVSTTGNKKWTFMWTAEGKRREMGLGTYPAVSLAKARDLAQECREQVADGLDPINERNSTKSAEMTFGEAANACIEVIKNEWSNDKHAKQWLYSLHDICAPLTTLPVNKINVEDVLAVLQPIWIEKHTTASRVRARIERVLNYAKTKGWREGENPALWRGNLQNLLPKKPRGAKKHHAAMPYQDVPAFMLNLRERKAMAAKALEFTILTASRTSEALNATWDEFDLEQALWVIPAERMKMSKEHSVPLSTAALDLLQELHKNRTGSLVFQRQAHMPDQPLSNMSMAMLLRRMKVEDVTVHGFRSAFRDWCGDKTSFPRDIAELALAHVVGGVEGAYRRGSALEKRRLMMQDWADFCAGRSVETAKILPFSA